MKTGSIKLSALALVAVMGVAAAFTVHAADESPLEKAMEKINSHYKAIRRDVRRGEFKEPQLKLVREMQVAAVVSMGEVPPLHGKKPAAEQPRFLINYKKEMAKFINALMDLEIAMLENRKADVEKIVEDLGKMKSDGHEKFTEE